MEDMYGREISIEKSIIESCKEVNLMRKGLKPERTWRELKAILEQKFAEDEAIEIPVRKVATRA